MAQNYTNRQQRIRFVLNYISIIKRDGTLPRENELQQTKSNITYWSRKLQALNIIKKDDKTAGLYIVLKSDEEVKEIYTNRIFVTTTNKRHNSKYNRVHSIQFKIQIPKFQKFLETTRKYLDKKGIQYILTKKNQIKLQMQYKGLSYTFILCQNTIIGYLPTGVDFIADDPIFAVEMAKAYIRKIAFQFNTYLGRDLRIKGDMCFQITRHHIAMMNNEIAKSLHRDRKELQVYIDGKLRVITDKSFNWDELEAITRNKAISDVDAMQNLIADVITRKDTLTDLEKSLLGKIELTQQLMLKQQEQISYLMEKQKSSVDFNRFKY